MRCGRLTKYFSGEGLTIPNALAKIEKELPKLPEVKHLIQFVQSSGARPSARNRIGQASTCL